MNHYYNHYCDTQCLQLPNLKGSLFFISHPPGPTSHILPPLRPPSVQTGLRGVLVLLGENCIGILHHQKQRENRKTCFKSQCWISWWIHLLKPTNYLGKWNIISLTWIVGPFGDDFPISKPWFPGFGRTVRSWWNLPWTMVQPPFQTEFETKEFQWTRPTHGLGHRLWDLPTSNTWAKSMATCLFSWLEKEGLGSSDNVK